jgi:hypothetical protein
MSIVAIAENITHCTVDSSRARTECSMPMPVTTVDDYLRFTPMASDESYVRLQLADYRKKVSEYRYRQSSLVKQAQDFLYDPDNVGISAVTSDCGG